MKEESRIGILISGRGSNMEAILREAGFEAAEIQSLLADNVVWAA